MGTRIRIMDMEVDLITQETFRETIMEYLSNDCLRVVHMVSLDYIDTFDKNELVRQVLDEADMVLPGEKTILSAHHVDVLETGGMVVDYHSLLDLVEPLAGNNVTFYLVLRNEKEARALYGFMNRHFSRECVVGVYVADSDVAEESLINDINTKLPDIIFLSMDSTEQEEWLTNHKGKLNARLCLAAGSVLPLILRDHVHAPAWLEKLHLAPVYRRLVKMPNSYSVRRRIFNQKLDHYNTKKKWRE